VHVTKTETLEEAYRAASKTAEPRASMDKDSRTSSAQDYPRSLPPYGKN